MKNKDYLQPLKRNLNFSFFILSFFILLVSAASFVAVATRLSARTTLVTHAALAAVVTALALVGSGFACSLFGASATSGLSFGASFSFLAWSSFLAASAGTFLASAALSIGSAVASFIAVTDLTKAGDMIRNATYNAWIPLLTCAIIYLILTVGLTKLFGAIEKRMAKSDRS